MQEILEILFKPIDWAIEVLQLKFYGIPLSTVILSLIIINALFGFFVFPIFRNGGSMASDFSDKVNKRQADRRKEKNSRKEKDY